MHASGCARAYLDHAEYDALSSGVSMTVMKTATVSSEWHLLIPALLKVKLGGEPTFREHDVRDGGEDDDDLSCEPGLLLLTGHRDGRILTLVSS